MISFMIILETLTNLHRVFLIIYCWELHIYSVFMFTQFGMLHDNLDVLKGIIQVNLTYVATVIKYGIFAQYLG